ncbi:AAA family ATPase [Novosphingobium aquimarinum]|uniref:AAA family ATPase n=1 Tax=Novosphingobium aquimarinum TaxID=2682494 RepID=UPI0012EB69C5|nr:AAA family ATPase [Novosphingobium aquimarinum]
MFTSDSASVQVPRGVDWALYAAGCGFRVIPLSESKVPFGNAEVAAAQGIPGPLAGQGGVYLATQDSRRIRAMWAKWPNASVGLAMGNGLLALDIDEKNGKSGSATMEVNGWLVPKTAMQRTPSGGVHYLVTIPASQIAPTDKGTDGLGDGIDRRGDGGYIVLYDSGILSSQRAVAPQWTMRSAPAARDAGRKFPPGKGKLAPTYELALEALRSCDVDADRNHWLLASGAFVTASVGLATTEQRLADWQAWCAGHGATNDPAANVRQWRAWERSGTDGDWLTLARLSGNINAMGWAAFGGIMPAIPITGKASSKRNLFVRVADLQASPPVFLIDDIMEVDSTACLFGDPGSGKSLIAMDMAACIATGQEFHGHKVKPGSVFYIAGEGQNGLRRRFAAWEALQDKSLKDAALFSSTASVRLLDDDSVSEAVGAIDQLATRYGMPRLIVIDTLARNFGAGDENSTEAMNKFVAALDRLRERYAGSTILIVHHSGHGDKQRARGSSVLRGAIDCEYKVEKTGDKVTLTNSKMKDAKPPSAMSFVLSQEAGSVGLEYTGASSDKISIHDRMALDALAAIGGAGTKDEWRGRFYERHQSDKIDTKRKAFDRVVKSLVTRQAVQLDGGEVYRIPPMPRFVSR